MRTLFNPTTQGAPSCPVCEAVSARRMTRHQDFTKDTYVLNVKRSSCCTPQWF